MINPMGSGLVSHENRMEKKGPELVSSDRLRRVLEALGNLEAALEAALSGDEHNTVSEGTTPHAPKRMTSAPAVSNRELLESARYKTANHALGSSAYGVEGVPEPASSPNGPELHPGVLEAVKSRSEVR